MHPRFLSARQKLLIPIVKKHKLTPEEGFKTDVPIRIL